MLYGKTDNKIESEESNIIEDAGIKKLGRES